LVVTFLPSVTVVEVEVDAPNARLADRIKSTKLLVRHPNKFMASFLAASAHLVVTGHVHHAL
jgi:hypothetical protein